MTESVLIDLATTLVGAGGGDHGDSHAGSNWLFIASLFTNFVIFFGFLIWKAAPAVASGLKSRRSTMAVELERAQEKQAKAEARLAEYEEKLQNLEREVAHVVESYEKVAEADRARTEAETEKALARMARETDFTIQQEMRKAERLIRRSAVEATLRIAEEKIKSRINPDDHRRLTDQYVASLDGRTP